MKTTDELIDALKEWAGAANPGLVTREDLQRLENKLDDVLKLVDALAARLGRVQPTSVEKPPRRRR